MASRKGFFGSRAPQHQQSFVLEPILTPSGFIDGGDDTPDPVNVELVTPLDDEFEISTDEGDITDGGEDLAIHPEEIPDVLADDDLEEISFVTQLDSDQDITDQSQDLVGEDLDTLDTPSPEDPQNPENVAETDPKLLETQDFNPVAEITEESNISENPDSETSLNLTDTVTEETTADVASQVDQTDNSVSKLDPDQVASISLDESNHSEDNSSDSNTETPQENTLDVTENTEDLSIQNQTELPPESEVNGEQLNSETELETDNQTASEETTTELTPTEPIQAESQVDVVDAIATSTPNFEFDSGVFTVGENGEVGIDYLFDGGKYKGQLAIFSLDGMEQFEPGSSEFIQEAASRALSNSELGHIVIYDATEGAKFSGELSNEVDWNQGEYQGVKTFNMQAGDQFAIMLVPNGKVAQIFHNPDAEDALRPLFSLATANPEDGFNVGQIADVTGDGNTFVMEDLRVDGNTDKDYNDIIFQVRGATGKAVHLDEVINPAKDWRTSDLGEGLIAYAKPYITPEDPLPEIEDDLASLVDELDGLLTDDSDLESETSPEVIVDETTTEVETESEVIVDETTTEVETESEVIVDETTTEVETSPEVIVDETTTEVETSPEVIVAETNPELETQLEVIVAETTTEVETESEVIVAETTTEVETESEVIVAETNPELETQLEVIVAEDNQDLIEEIEPIVIGSEQNDTLTEVETPEYPTETINNPEEISSNNNPIVPLNITEDNSEIIESEITPIVPQEPNNPLVDRLENLTQQLRHQTVSEQPVNQTLITRLEQLTTQLQNKPSTSINSTALQLIEKLEAKLGTQPPIPTTVEPPVQFQFAPEKQPLVGVIDTGFSGDNPDIDYTQITWGSDKVDGDTDPTLAAGIGNEHGTHVLGIIAAQQNNGIGIDGINDNAPIWAGRAIGSGKWAESLVEFVDAAKASGQPNAVVNLSLDLTQINPDGSVTTRYELTPQERAAIEYARQNGVLIVAASGNDGSVMSVLGQASQEFDNIITVGAAQRINDQIALSKAYNRADYSSYGRGLDIMADGGTVENPVLSTTGDGVGTMAGTSVATAKVTGAISQVWAANPELSYRQVIEILKQTATDLGEPNWDGETGAGLINIAAAVSLAKVTTGKEYDVLATLIPNTWGGEGKVTPEERAVNIVDESFSAWVVSSNGINLRNSPNTSDRSNYVVNAGDTLTFDGWTYGETLNDLTTQEADALWYRFRYNGGTYWVPSAWTGGYPGSRPPLLPPAQPPAQQYQQPPVSQQPTNNTVYLSTDAGEILQVDESTGASHKIYQGRAFTDLAVAPNGKLYGCTFFDGLYEINPSTGAERYVGPLAGGTLNSLTFSTDGRLYGADQGNGNLFQISPDNGQMNLIGNLGGPSSGDLVFNGANEILATVGSPYTSSDRLVVFNLATGTSRNVGDLGLREVYGLTLENGQLRAYTSDRRKIAIDMNTGATSVIGNVSSQGLIWGAGDIPESLPSATDNVRQKFLYAASLYPQVGNAITGVQDQGGGVFRQEFERAIMIWNGQQVTVYETNGSTSSTTSPSSTPQVNNPSGFNPVVFTRSVGVDTNYGIKLRTDTNLNARGEGVTHDSQIEFDGWKYGEPVQDQTVANGQMDALWYRIKGTNYWIPSAFMIGYPPGNPAVLPGGSNGNTGGNNNNTLPVQPADFTKALAFVRRWEGGYVNHPNDPGGATNKGITQNTYNSYRASKGLSTQDVRGITDGEVQDIYYTNYWIASGSNQLTSRLAMVNFDTAVNMGVGAASKLLQQARQSSNGDEMSVVRRYLDLREAEYRAIVASKPSMGVFLNGWLNRLNSLRAEVGATGSSSNNNNGGNSNNGNNNNNNQQTQPSESDIGEKLRLSLKGYFNGLASFAESTKDAGPYLSASQKLLASVQEMLGVGVKEIESLPVYKQLESLGIKGADWVKPELEKFYNFLKPKVNEIASKIGQSLSVFLRKAADVVDEVMFKILSILPVEEQLDLLIALDKLSKKPSAIFESIKNFDIDEAWEKLKKAFSKVGGLFEALFEKLPINLKGVMGKVTGFMKQGPNLIKAVGYALDGNQIFFGDGNIELVDSGIPKGILKVIGSTIGSALLGGLVQVPASGVPGIGNAILGALAAFAGAWAGDILGGWLWDILESGFKLVVKGFQDLLEATVKAAQDAAKKFEDFKNSWEYKILQFYNFITGKITVYAAEAENREQEAKIVAQLWREQFGTKYDWQLSDAARSYLY